MKRKTMVSILGLLLITQCSIPESEELPVNRLGVATAEFQNSAVHKDLVNAGYTLDIENTELGEFNQTEYLSVPIKNDPSRAATSARSIYQSSHFILKYSINGTWNHFLRISLQGSAQNEDLSDFSGVLLIDDYIEEVVLKVNYIGGRFQSYTIDGGSADNQRRVISSLRNGAISGCESICHLLDCVGRKFEEKSWFSKLLCTFAGFPLCLAGDIADCIKEGCENSYYRKCGDL